MERKDKKAYSYKQSLEQPTWVRGFGKYFKTTNPFKFSRLVYIFILFLPFFLLLKLVWFLPVNWNVILSLFLSLLVAINIEDLKIDGRIFFFYAFVYLRYYLMYGVKAGKIYINKGEVYRKIAEEKKR